MSKLIVYRKINWKIDCISRELLCKGSKYKSVSKTITVNLPGNNQTQWIIEFSPNLNPCEFSIFKLRVNKDNVFLKASLFVEKYDGTLQYISSSHGNSCEFDEDEGFTFPNMFRPQDMLAQNTFLKENTLSFIIELELDEVDLEPTKSSDQLNKGLLSLSDFEKILSFELSDLTIICSDQEEIKVHKFVLALKCPILMEMLEAEATDCGNNKIKLNDIDSKTMKALVLYLYTGDLVINQSMSSKLLYAAEKFQLNNLKTICISSLSESLELENVLETLILADHYEEKILEENCIGFIKMNFYKLKDAKDWIKLDMRHALKIMISLEKNPITFNITSSLN
ncbi:unnamed protein product [Chironomus riparius]|uniref:BTB domain-containing protein n=1 Tax=Chironomus riparius TaxID=315576 RepID=A0A9N9S0C5_9DIPT|nr:unnamed protein product [Chironomus riparius]